MITIMVISFFHTWKSKNDDNDRSSNDYNDTDNGNKDDNSDDNYGDDGNNNDNSDNTDDSKAKDKANINNDYDNSKDHDNDNTATITIRKPTMITMTAMMKGNKTGSSMQCIAMKNIFLQHVQKRKKEKEAQGNPFRGRVIRPSR